MTTRISPLRPLAASLTPPRTVAWGVGLAFAAAIVSGFSVWVNSYAVKEVRDPAVFTTAKNAIVGLALLAFLLRPGARLPRIPRSGRSRAMLLALGVVGGSIPFVLFFEGLARSGPGNAAFIQKTLFIWVAILAVPLLKERIGRWQLMAFAMLLVAQLLIGKPSSWNPGDGEWMVLAATGLWTVETIVARKLLADVPASLAATSRMALGGTFLLAYLAVQGKLGVLFGLNAEQWRWVIWTSAILLVYVVTWYSSLQRAPATVVTSILAVAAPITAALATWSGKPAPTADQVTGYAVVAVAALILAFGARRAARESAAAG